MKLFTFPTAPSPQRVHIFLLEKGVQIPFEFVDLQAKAQLSEAYRKINPRCTVPALVLEDGTVISEVISICHYLESTYPEIPLMGSNAKERALISEWDHRTELESLLAIADALRNKSDAFQGRALPGALDVEQIPELVPRGIARINGFFEILNEQLGDNQYVAGSAFSMADITAFVSVNFSRWVKVQAPEELIHLHRWHRDISRRPSVAEHRKLCNG